MITKMTEQEYKELVNEAESVIKWNRENNTGADHLQMFDEFSANVGWQDWMDNYLDDDVEEFGLTEQEEERINAVLVDVFTAAYGRV